MTQVLDASQPASCGRLILGAYTRRQSIPSLDHASDAPPAHGDFASGRSAERANHPNGGTALEESIKHQCDAGLDLQVRSLRHDARGIPDEPDRQRQSQLAALRLGQEARRQPAADRMQLKLRDGALETQQKPAVRGSRIVDAVAVGDQALPMPTNIEQRIPVGTVTGEPRDLDRQDDADFAERYPSDQILEALAMIDGRPAHAEIAVDHVHIRLMPAELARAV